MASLFTAKAKGPAQWLLKSTNKLAASIKHKARRLLYRNNDTPDLRRQPLVSILLVTYNSSDYLPRLLEALSRQVYGHFEVVCIDNASSDQSAALVEAWSERETRIPTIVEALSINTGYAEGVNRAYAYARGEYLALLNADAVPSENWLLEMVNAISRHPRHSAISPKILFDSPFSSFTLHFNQAVSLDLKTLVDGLPYPKLFVRNGALQHPDQIRTSESGCLVLELPAATSRLNLRLSPHQLTTAPDQSGLAPALMSLFPAPRGQQAPHAKLSADTTLSLELQAFHAPVYWLINNAGSTTPLGRDTPYDVGFAVRDSPRFDSPGLLPRRRFCGCSVLIRRAALLDRDLFIPEFFAYYEDSELSRWLLKNRRGKILYWPRAVLLHHHSSTLGEYSPSWTYLTSRSQLLYALIRRPLRLQANVARSLLPEQLHRLAGKASASGVDRRLITTIRDQDKNLIKKMSDGTSLVPSRRSIGIFNLFWNTYGGGEVHALHVARRLKDEHPECHVYLLSESDFDLDDLATYFNVNSEGLLKLIVPKVSTALTKRFWLFVNSTSHSSLASQAANSWYIVSFPHRSFRLKWMSTYTFLPNSKYTKLWMERWWGQHRCRKSQVLYPVAHLQCSQSEASESLPSSTGIPRILAVGRFTRRGHAKNQHLILEAFLEVANSIPADWQLNLVGSLDEESSDDISYYRELEHCIASSSHSKRIAISANVTRESLSILLHDSSVFVHATGLGQSSRHQPHLHEHFGIAPVEAALAGCIPVVYGIGGPAEVLQQTDCGYTFLDLVGLTATLRQICLLPMDAIVQQRCETRRRTQQWLATADRLPLPALRA